MVFPGNHRQISGSTTVDLNGLQTACVLVDYPHEDHCWLVSVLGLVVHELFHSHAYPFASGAGLDELAAYDTEDPVNNALCQVENELVAHCPWLADLGSNRDGGSGDDGVGGVTRGELGDRLAQYLAVRRFRRSRLTGEARSLEDTFERSEGSAQYAAIRSLVGLVAGEFDLTTGLSRVVEEQGLLAENDLVRQLENYINNYTGFLKRCNIQGFGGPMHRGYMVGAINCSLLDSMGHDWKSRFTEGTAPSELLAEVVDAGTEADVPDILQIYRYHRRREAETEYLEEKRRKERELAEGFDHAKNPVLIIDYSELPAKGRYSADPMNMVNLPDGRRVHTRVYTFQRPGLNLESHCVPPVPVMENGAARELSLPLPADMELSEEVDSIDYDKNGLKLKCAQCRVEPEGISFRVRCQDS